MAGKQTYHLKMNLMVQNLLISAFGTCKFVLQHSNHPITQAIRQFKLFDDEKLVKFIQQVKMSKPGQTLLLDLDDEIMIYTALDITCKAYLTDLGDRMKQMNESTLKKSNSDFAEIRNTILKGSQFVMEGMRESLSGIEAFEDRTDILENYILVG
jgi:hypothetical protein